MNLFIIIGIATVGKLISLLAGTLALTNRLQPYSSYFVSFAAGTMLGVAFLDLLPEAIMKNGAGVVGWSLVGIVLFFYLERSFRWFHHHHEHPTDPDHTNPPYQLLLLGDLLHTFLDAVAISVAFTHNSALGIALALAITTHEIPKQIGEFGVLKHMNISSRTIILTKSCIALLGVLTVLLLIVFPGIPTNWAGGLLAVSAGLLLYISLSDLVPTIHEKHSNTNNNNSPLLLLVGVLVVYCLQLFL